MWSRPLPIRGIQILIPLAIWGIARAISALFIIIAAEAQPDLTHDPAWHVEGEMPASPSYWQVLSNWDGQWYKTIALQGYPSVAPPEGVQNVFAFYPLYPLAVGGLMRITGLSFEVMAACVSLVAGTAAAVLLFSWLTRTRGRAVAAVAVAVLGTFPSSPALQAAYTDAPALALLILCLRAATERRWARLLGLGVVLSLTRPVVLPLAVFVLVLEFRRTWHRDLSDDRLSRSALCTAGSLFALSFLWPLLVCVRTGELSAYFDAAAAWVQFGGLSGGWYVGMWDMGLRIPAVLAAMLTLILVTLRWRRRREIGAEDGLGLWGGLYMLFILGTTTINTSIFRYALLAIVPLGSFGPMTLSPMSPRLRVVILSVTIQLMLALQWLWVRNVLVVDNSPGWPP